MRQELEQKLIGKWPKWFVNPKSQYLFRFECGDGWFDLIWQLCEDLQPMVPHDFHVVQVKEKFGGLRFYIAYGTMSPEASDCVDARINRAEDESLKTCERCGQPGEPDYTQHWISTRCPGCRGEEHQAAEQEDKPNGEDEKS